MNSQAVVLAGGFGTRLEKVIGNKIPKPMALINGKPLLLWTVECLKRNKIKRVLFLLHHNHQYIIDFFKDGSDFGIKIDYSIEKKPRGTAGAIFDNIHKLEDEFFIIYGDTFIDVDLLKMKSTKRPEDKLIAFVHPSSHPYDSDLIKINKDNKITDIFRPSNSDEKYYQNITNAALYYSHKDIFKNEKSLTIGVHDIASNLFPLMIKKNISIKAYESPEYIKDMGTPERYKIVNEHVKKNIPELLSSRVKRKCLFLDRDGIININNGHINSLKKFEIRKEIINLIKLFNDSGWLIIVVTNQPVIARGDLTIEGLNEIHKKMSSILGNNNVYLNHIYYCPHHPDSGFEGEIKELKIDCNCRKPKPGMINKAINDFNIDKDHAWLLGDDIRDIQAALNANVSPILLDEESYYKEEDFEQKVIVRNSLTSIYNFLREKL